MMPSFTSIPMAAGSFGRPGMRMMSPATATTKRAPALTINFWMVMLKLVALPTCLALSVNENWVFAIQTGHSLAPKASISFKLFFAASDKITPLPPYTF